jgi:hypothetical protein
MGLLSGPDLEQAKGARVRGGPPGWRKSRIPWPNWAEYRNPVGGADGVWLGSVGEIAAKFSRLDRGGSGGVLSNRD